MLDVMRALLLLVLAGCASAPPVAAVPTLSSPTSSAAPAVPQEPSPPPELVELRRLNDEAEIGHRDIAVLKYQIDAIVPPEPAPSAVPPKATHDVATEDRLEAEARKHCRWANDPITEVRLRKDPRTGHLVKNEQYGGIWRSQPVCDKDTPPEVLKAANRIANRLVNQP